MDLLPTFQEMCQDYGKFRAALASAAEHIDDPEMAAYLRGLTGEMDQAFAEVQREVPDGLRGLTAAVDEAQRDLDQANRDIKAASAELERVRQQVEAGIEIPEPPLPEPGPTDAELDGLFGQLRSELLDRFGDPVVQETKDQVLKSREAWDDWTAFGHPR